MILSNITTPLLGLVDTAVIGHLEHAYYLGGIALGSMIISITFWLAGFLRMTTTGVLAQAFANDDSSNELAWRLFFHSIFIAMALALSLLILQQPLIEGALWLAGASSQVSHYAGVYFDIRIYSAPAALINMVLLGFFVARQQVRWVVYQLFTINVINIALDLFFVVGLEWGVAGAALASVIADYCGLVLLCWIISPTIKQLAWRRLVQVQPALIKRLVGLNRDIFIRSLALQLCLAAVTVTGAKLGDVTIAANAILLNMFMFASYGLDGFAYAAESLVGEAKGKKDSQRLQQVVFSCAVFCGAIGGCFALGLWLWGELWINFMTTIEPVQQATLQYLPWMIAICAIAWLSFLMDGVFIGLTNGKAMRNTMIIAAAVFFVVLFLSQSVSPSLNNHGLWLAFFCFMLTRGVSLSWCYREINH
ncbi:MATE family efflux transporter [Alteromonadales bacterium alter-6D02]|nr:MATE family efflux transporter [Alteromonadales bacterium alter-6D02]